MGTTVSLAERIYFDRWYTATVRGPLAGVRVISFPTGIVGPALGSLLAEHGAEVISIEAGRSTRSPQRGQKFQIASDLESNRDRKRIVLDMKHPDGLALAKNSSPSRTSWSRTSAPA